MNLQRDNAEKEVDDIRIKVGSLELEIIKLKNEN